MMIKNCEVRGNIEITVGMVQIVALSRFIAFIWLNMYPWLKNLPIFVCLWMLFFFFRSLFKYYHD